MLKGGLPLDWTLTVPEVPKMYPSTLASPEPEKLMKVPSSTSLTEPDRLCAPVIVHVLALKSIVNVPSESDQVYDVFVA